MAGESAGGQSTSVHLVSPSSAGLFVRAIGESADEGFTNTIEQALNTMARRVLLPSLSHRLSHSDSLVAVMKPKELKTKISHAHSLILSLSLSLTYSPSLVLVVMLRSTEFKTSRSVLMLIL